ncbi:MAG: S49 family peptidase [Candidatus Moranbacteria bacterium]|nr:S49 family peptidase [Candidatus Moranbacteria bacterium]
MKNKLLYISVLAILFIIALYFLWSWREALLVMVKVGTAGQTEGTEQSDLSCNIAVVPIVGEIIPYAGADKDGSGNELPPTTNADDVLSLLRAAESNPNMRGVLVRIDSNGGTPVASEIISNALKRTPLPVVALIREMGTSGAYLAATGARTIIASPFSNIGSIGVTMSYLENTRRNAQEGLQYVPLASAQFKDYGNPDKSLTYAERMLIERDLTIYHKQFVEEVAKNRNLPLEQVAKLADGSAMPGALALENGLVDALGDQQTARVWFADNLTISSTNVVFCE